MAGGWPDVTCHVVTIDWSWCCVCLTPQAPRCTKSRPPWLLSRLGLPLKHPPNSHPPNPPPMPAPPYSLPVPSLLRIFFTAYKSLILLLLTTSKDNTISIPKSLKILCFVYFGPPQLSVCTMLSAAATAETCSYSLAYKGSTPVHLELGTCGPMEHFQGFNQKCLKPLEDRLIHIAQILLCRSKVHFKSSSQTERASKLVISTRLNLPNNTLQPFRAFGEVSLLDPFNFNPCLQAPLRINNKIIFILLFLDHFFLTLNIPWIFIPIHFHLSRNAQRSPLLKFLDHFAPPVARRNLAWYQVGCHLCQSAGGANKYKPVPCCMCCQQVFLIVNLQNHEHYTTEKERQHGLTLCSQIPTLGQTNLVDRLV
ncbi:hypothetical protein VP01_4787g1 [Puccinia sorghi]|uniref:Uncharacterized protein n=1 Tax=Puccinia sorghi TaxID=27349 RepID=A0A0L6UNF1_9BASI|nr:hypothetical protein VP01_4787g1 [Puccinia sorghi]